MIYLHKILRFCFWGVLSLIFFHQSFAQDTSRFSAPPSDSGEVIHLLNADILLGIQPTKKDSSQLQKLIGNVRLRQGQTLFTCDSALQNLTKNTIDAWGHIHINQADTINTYADFLHYEGNTKVATLKNNVRMTDGQMVLTTNYLVYDMNTHIGSYLNSGKLVNKSTVLTSERGYYYADTKDVYFKTNVQLTDPEYTLATDTLLYNTNTRIAHFVAPTTINTGKSIIYTSCGYYSTVENYAHLCNRATIVDSTRQLTADSMNYSKVNGIGKAYGNVIWTDTARKITVLANYAVSNQAKKTILATQNPLMILRRESDTLYIASDTLFSGPLSEDTTSLQKTDSALAKMDTTLIKADSALTKTDTISHPDSTLSASNDSTQLRNVIAYHHVLLFSDSLQGAADSLYYSDLDSAFRFFREPVLWTGNTQLTGDTIVLYTKNQKASRLVLDQHALIINKVADNFFNQIKGNIVTGYFKENNQLDWMHVNGNAECIYYAVEDDNGAFVGVNHTTAASINLYFKDGKLDKVKFMNDVDGTFYPPLKMPVEERRLRGFRWETERRPESKADLMY